MSRNPPHICSNCDTVHEATFKFCSNCGQKNTDGKISFSELWTEFQDAVFNIESRTWRTLKNLFVPGKLTLEYFSGKHKKYVHPLRLLIVTSLLLIISMSFQDFQSATNHRYNIREQILKNYERQRLFRIVEEISDSTNVIFKEQDSQIITDTILSTFRDSLRGLLPDYGDRYGDSINLHKYVSMGYEKPENISKYDFLTLGDEELAVKYKRDNGWLERLIFKQKLKLVNDESQIFAALIGHITWAVLLMMPFLALILSLLNFRHGYFYIEHLIFTFHLHAFIFLLVAIMIAGMYIFPSWLFFVFIAAILIYLFLSMLNVYMQSLGKTLIKFILFGTSYLVVLVIFLIGNILASFLLL